MNTVLWGPLALGAADWLQLFLHFTMLSLLAVGGAIATVPEMQRFVVGQQGWLDAAQFSACIALGQAAPGPNVLFVAAIGYSVGGLAGVGATLAGTLLPSTTLALMVSRWGGRPQQARGMRAFTAGMAPLTIGLLLATGWTLLRPAGLDWRALALVAATLWLMLRTQRNVLWALGAGALLGALGWV